jgi:hypothetical protein
MCDFFDWDRDDEERAEARQAFRDAMVFRFNSLYGTDVNNLDNWHKLCIAVCIEPLPATINECEQVCDLQPLWLTLISLVIENQRNTCESRRLGGSLRAGGGVVYVLG